jgi:hypothetical protein
MDGSSDKFEEIGQDQDIHFSVSQQFSDSNGKQCSVPGKMQHLLNFSYV